MKLAIRTLPLPILISAFIFFLIPLMSYYSTASLKRIAMANFVGVLHAMTPLQLVIMVLSLLLVYGLVQVKKYAYYLFLLFSSILISYNVWMIYRVKFHKGIMVAGRTLSSNEILYNALFTFILLGLIFYFLRKEVSAPYMSLVTRGFRGNFRDTVPVPVVFSSMDGEFEGAGATESISSTGCLIPMKDNYPILEGDSLDMVFSLEEKGNDVKVSLKGSVVRLVPGESGQNVHLKLGVRFDESPTQWNNIKVLRNFLKDNFTPRFFTNAPVEFGRNGYSEATGQLFNLSEDGMYIDTTHTVQSKETLKVRLRTIVGDIDMDVVVRWANPQGKYGKNAGFGAEIITVKDRLKFRLYLFRLALHFHYTR
jgi:hypothetical protein